MPKKPFPKNALDDLVSQGLADKLRLVQDLAPTMKPVQDAMKVHQPLDGLRQQQNQMRQIAKSMKFTAPALEAIKAFQTDPALLQAAKGLTFDNRTMAALRAVTEIDTSAIDWMKALKPQLDVAAAFRSSLLGSGVLDEVNKLSGLTAQWRSAFEGLDKLTGALPRDAFSEINRLAESLRGSMPVVPALDPALFGGAWNDDLAGAVERLREHAQRVADDPEADIEDVAAVVVNIEVICAATPPGARNRVNVALVGFALWLLDKTFEDPAKELIREALAALLIVLSSVTPATPPALPAPPALFAPAPLPAAPGALVIPGGWQVEGLPDIIRRAGPQAERRTLEFFTANIRNPNTRQAYAHAVMRFMNWCDDRQLELLHITPFAVAAYIEKMGREYAAPTVKQHLAAIRMLFDYLVVGQVLPMNPASSVRGPKHVVKKGKTRVLQPDEARLLLDSIDVSELSGLRDRALLGVMLYSFARVSAVVAMNVDDYYQQGRRWWLRLHEKGGQHHEVPVHHKAEEYLDAYIKAAGLQNQAGSPLWRTLTKERLKDETGKRDRRPTDNRMTRIDVFRMIKRRVRDAELGAAANCHTLRATGITAYLLNGGTLERAQAIAAHESPRTTKLYDPRSAEPTVDDMEKIAI